MIHVGTHSVSKVEFYRWVDALRSGKYEQTTGVLQDSKGYCCLGVACKVNTKNNSSFLNG